MKRIDGWIKRKMSWLKDEIEEEIEKSKKHKKDKKN